MSCKLRPSRDPWHSCEVCAFIVRTEMFPLCIRDNTSLGPCPVLWVCDEHKVDEAVVFPENYKKEQK
jgi:hypothetical protein